MNTQQEIYYYVMQSCGSSNTNGYFRAWIIFGAYSLGNAKLYETEKDAPHKTVGCAKNALATRLSIDPDVIKNWNR